MIGSRGATRTGRNRGHPRGAALAELAIVLPFLCLILVASTDFARVFHDLMVITDGARNGAIYASRHAGQAANAYKEGIRAAALADASGLAPAPTVTFESGSLGAGNDYVDVTVRYTFRTLSNFPGIPNSVPLLRKVRMRVPPSTYRMK